MHNFVIALTNKFFQTYHKTVLTYFPIYVENITPDQLPDSNMLILNINTSAFHGYVEVDDVITFKDDRLQYKKLLKVFNICQSDNLLFVKFREINWFSDLRYTIDICKQLYEMEINIVVPTLYDIDVLKNADTIINEIELAEETFIPSSFQKRYVNVKCNPCFDLIQELESSFDENCCKLIVQHYNCCESCEKIFNTNEQIDEIFYPLCFTMYKDNPIVANSIINGFDTNTPFEEQPDEVMLSNDYPNIIYLSDCNKYNNYTIFIAP